MAKTKTLGIRLSPYMISELERLKESFDFKSYSEMLEILTHLLTGMDELLSQIGEHPSEWGKEEIEEFLRLGHETLPTGKSVKIRDILLRRLRKKFGEDGVEKLERLLSQNSIKIG